MELYICTTCNKEKRIEEFNKNIKKKNGISTVCKVCHSEYRKKHYIKNKDKIIAQVKLYNKNNKLNKKAGRTLESFCDKCDNIVFITKKEKENNVKRYCSQECKRLNNKSTLAFYISDIKKRATKTNKDFDLDEEFLKDLLEEKQNNKCAISNVDIFLKGKNEKKKNLYDTASLDRIDSSLGYTKNNVQWVVLGINYMKLNFKESQLHILLGLIKEKYTSSIIDNAADSKPVR